MHGYAGYATYQPAIRYWPFQFIEAGIFAVLTALLIALAFITAGTLNGRGRRQPPVRTSAGGRPGRGSGW